MIAHNILMRPRAEGVHYGHIAKIEAADENNEGSVDIQIFGELREYGQMQLGFVQVHFEVG